MNVCVYDTNQTGSCSHQASKERSGFSDSKALVSSVEEVQRSEGQRGVGTEGKVSYGPMSGAKNSVERLSLSLGLPYPRDSS